MDTTSLEGETLPSGEVTVEKWMAHLWADATRNDEDAFRYDEDARASGADGQLAPYSLCQYVAFSGTGGVEETMSRLAEDWTEGAALGQLRAEFESPILVGETYQVDGWIDNVEQKEGDSGSLSIVTVTYEVRTADGKPAYDLEADMIIMEDL